MHSFLPEFEKQNLHWHTKFKAVDWHSTKNRKDQCVCANVMKFFKGTPQTYGAEIIHPANQD